MNNFEQQYRELLTKILFTGDYKVFRGHETKSLVGGHIAVDMQRHGFPIITGRDIKPNIFISELKWFLEGTGRIADLEAKGVKIWSGYIQGSKGILTNSYPYYFSTYAPVILQNLQERNFSRRMAISLWDNTLHIDSTSGYPPPCYTNIQFHTDGGVLDMVVTYRSTDALVGLPYDMCLFASFLIMMATKSTLMAGRIFVNFGDVHIYLEQIEEAMEYLSTPYTLAPQFYTYEDGKDLYDWEIELRNYAPYTNIKLRPIL